MTDDLPQGWTAASFMDVFDIQGGAQPPKSTFKYEPTDGYVRLLQIRDFGSKPVPTFIRKKPTVKTCKKDDVLIGRYGVAGCHSKQYKPKKRGSRQRSECVS